MTRAVGGGWNRGRKADPVQDEWEQNWGSGGGSEEQGAVLRIVQKVNGEGLGSEDIWEMGKKGELRTAPMFLTWATGGAISQEEWVRDAAFRFKGVALEVPEEQAKGESILVKAVRNQ